MKFGYLRADDDGHDYLVPEEEIEAFDELWEKVENTPWNSGNWCEIVDEFNDKYWKYALGESPRYLKIVMPE